MISTTPLCSAATLLPLSHFGVFLPPLQRSGLEGEGADDQWHDSRLPREYLNISNSAED